MYSILRKLWKNTTLFFFSVALVFTILGFFLTQIRGIGEEITVQFGRPLMAITVTITQGLGYFLIGIGLLSWTAFLVSIIIF